MLTKLDAINSCLAGISLAPVATDDEDNLDLDAAAASQVIDRISMHIQSKGWWFNEEREWKITPDAVTGYIAVPNSALSMIPTGVSNALRLSIRGNKVYDLEDHTFDLSSKVYTTGGSDTGYIEFTMIMGLDYADMPPVARMAVGYAARRQFAQDMEVDERRWNFQVKEEENAMAALLSEDARNKKRNSFTSNPTMASFILRVGGPNAWRKV